MRSKVPSNDAGKIDPQADLDPHDDDDLVTYNTVLKLQKFTLIISLQKFREINACNCYTKLHCMLDSFTKFFSIESKLLVFPHCVYNVAEIRHVFENDVLANSCTNHHSARIFFHFVCIVNLMRRFLWIPFMPKVLELCLKTFSNGQKFKNHCFMYIFYESLKHKITSFISFVVNQ